MQIRRDTRSAENRDNKPHPRQHMDQRSKHVLKRLLASYMGYNKYMDKDKDVTPRHQLNGPPKEQKDIKDIRMDICKTCDFFRPKTQTCQKCGCFMKAKSTIANAKCPVGKW